MSCHKVAEAACCFFSADSAYQVKEILTIWYLVYFNIKGMETSHAVSPNGAKHHSRKVIVLPTTTEWTAPILAQANMV